MAQPGLLRLIAQSKGVMRALRGILGGTTPIQYVGAQGYARLAVAASIVEKTDKPAIFVFPTPEEAVIARRDLGDLLGTQRVFLFPAREVMPFDAGASPESLWMRTRCLEALCQDNGEKPVVVMPAIALARRIMSKKAFLARRRVLVRGSIVTPYDIAKDLVDAGYERIFALERPGQFALRGGILDVFPPSSTSPFRLEFAFDEIESIRTFDLETQRSSDTVESVSLCPASDDAPGEGSIFDYIGEDGLVMVDAIERCHDALAEFERIGAEIASSRMIAGAMGKEEASIYLPAALGFDFLAKGDLMFSVIARHQEGVRPKDIVDSDTLSQVGFAGRWADFVLEIRGLLQSRARIVVLGGNKDRLSMVERLLERREIPNLVPDSSAEVPGEGLVTLTLGSGENGFAIPELNLSVFTEAEVYGRQPTPRRRRKTAKSGLDWRELSTGDYVVHATHGIGQFMGIKTMTVGEITRDYLHLRYAGADTLYVPIDQVDLVERYVGVEGKPPRLQKLGTGDWARIKAKVKASVEDMARRLLVLEAKRKSRHGYAFGPDTPWQRQFEESFEYEDTPDQATATEEIKKDMEEATPMDRLLCGDVGYGKTEVAIRSAFKAVLDGKQVGVLVPTTILAEQHFQTFTQRVVDHPITVACLSRFRTPAETRKILEDVQSGAADIIVGTHRLLSKDVVFKNLGLLIVDEEHRFGVAQKERLKEIADNCDVLTLTATPIPRTLNMALSGIRDISVIETPPEGRFPVETYVVPMNPSLLSQAIRREIRRGGQVFYVHNRIHSIARVLARVQGMAPEARIALAHGRMPEHQLSLTMQDFLQGRYDILISTTIIESGLDLPNVNTLIVEDADKLGLAQLYQLRGRVGRSNRIAYAYFTYRHDRSMTYVAEQRLGALRDFSAMGSGFRLAMRDMEIRGAGNLLGAEQHGFMTAVGYEMYVSLLEKAVRSLRGQEDQKTERILTVVDVPVSAFLPETYIENSRERFAFYKRIAAADSEDRLVELGEEMRDRYGETPGPVRDLLLVAKLRLLLGAIGVTQVSVNTEDVVMNRERILLKIEVAHLFPLSRLPRLHKQLPGLTFDQRQRMVSVPLTKGKDSPLAQCLALAALLSASE